MHIELNRIYNEDCLETATRKPDGRFLKGTHWRKRKPYWIKEWLNFEYIINLKPAKQIAKEQGCTENNILYFLKKHGIKTRSMSEIRSKKNWGLCGSKNGIFGRTGLDNPNWDGGHSPERQSKYARSAWKILAKSILKRDNYRCNKCDSGNKLIVHHIKKWSRYPELRFTPSNLLTVCEVCHRKIHSRRKL